MIIVTGGAGFIGSNLIHALNQRGESNIILVDDLSNGQKIHNIADLAIADYFDKNDFIEKLSTANFLNRVRTVFHLGACSKTTEWNGQYIMENNYDYSKRLLLWCISKSYKSLS
jgi:ADP-L-glycero-D-manno-heptose 6-epimerase